MEDVRHIDDQDFFSCERISKKLGIPYKGIGKTLQVQLVPLLFFVCVFVTGMSGYIGHRFPGNFIYIVAGSGVVFFISVGILLSIIGKQTKDMREMAIAAAKLAAGDTDYSCPKNIHSEVGIVFASLDVIKNHLLGFKQQFAHLRNSTSVGDIRIQLKTENLSGVYYGIAERANAYIGSVTAYLDVIGLPIFCVDPAHNLVYVNNDAAALVGQDGNQIIGKKCYEYFKCDHCQTEKCIVDRAIGAGKTTKDEAKGIYNGQEAYVNQYAIAIMDFEDNFKITAGLESIVDVTHVHRLKNEANEKALLTEKQMQTAKKQAEFQEKYIQSFTTSLEQIARGELNIKTQQFEWDEDTKQIHDNFGKLGEVLTDTAATIKSYIEELSHVLERIAEKDLKADITREYVGEFSELKSSINIILENLNEVFYLMGDKMTQIQSESRQMAGASQSLAQGASEQSGAVSEISSTIMSLTEKTKINVESATKASKLSIHAKEDAQAGSRHMDEMLVAMEEIKQASSGIANIIKSIEDIAFQTNILALNAAVEAARAGEHGRGFAVVAEEVRSLAGRSANAAKETTELIENSIAKVQNGVGIANETANALEKIVEGIADTVEIVVAIADASKEQESAITQIQNEMEQIGKVTQKNTSTSQETAESSEKLSSQSQMMQDMMQEFSLKETGHHLEGTKRLLLS